VDTVEEELERSFSKNFVRATNDNIKEKYPKILKFLDSGQAVVNIPMKEKGNQISSFLSVATRQISNKAICIVDNGSSEKAIKAVERYPEVVLIDKDEIFETLDWRRLFPILNLEEIPDGKGAAVLAGYLFRYFSNTNKTSQWIFHCDADVEEYKNRFMALEYLSYAVLCSQKNILHIRMAKSKRNNEPFMAARNLLLMLEYLPDFFAGKESRKIARRAKILFTNLAKYKWMLSGAFALQWHVAMSRPVASGYLDETLTCAYMEDLSLSLANKTVQIANPNPCSDRENGDGKENEIIQKASNFVIALAFARTPVSRWGIKKIRWINHKLMDKPGIMAFIPGVNEEPVKVRTIHNERILPSVEMILKNDLIDKKSMKKIVGGYT